MKHAEIAGLSEEQIKSLHEQLAEMLKQEYEIKELQKTHKCWLHVPSLLELEQMKEVSKNDKCPKCGQGRLVIEIYKGNIGDNLYFVCKWGKDCDYKKWIECDD